MSGPGPDLNEYPAAPEAAVADDAGPPRMTLGAQLIRFALSGGVAGIVDFGLLLLFLHMGLPFVVAKTISFIAGTATAYLINRRWTFPAPPSRKRFLAVAALYATMFVVQVGISTFLHSQLPPERSGCCSPMWSRRVSPPPSTSWSSDR